MSRNALPALSLAAVPRRRRATLDLAREIERRGFANGARSHIRDSIGALPEAKRNDPGYVEEMDAVEKALAAGEGDEVPFPMGRQPRSTSHGAIGSLAPSRKPKFGTP